MWQVVLVKLVILNNLSDSFLIIFLRQGSHCVTHVGLELIAIPLSQLPECSDYRRSQLTIFYRPISSANGGAVISFQSHPASLFLFICWRLSGSLFLLHHAVLLELGWWWSRSKYDNKTEAPHALLMVLWQVIKQLALPQAHGWGARRGPADLLPASLWQNFLVHSSVSCSIWQVRVLGPHWKREHTSLPYVLAFSPPSFISLQRRRGIGWRIEQTSSYLF